MQLTYQKQKIETSYIFSIVSSVPFLSSPQKPKRNMKKKNH